MHSMPGKKKRPPGHGKSMARRHFRGRGEQVLLFFFLDPKHFSQEKAEHAGSLDNNNLHNGYLLIMFIAE